MKEQLKSNRENFMKEIIDLKGDHIHQTIQLQNKIQELTKRNKVFLSIKYSIGS